MAVLVFVSTRIFDSRFAVIIVVFVSVFTQPELKRFDLLAVGERTRVVVFWESCVKHGRWKNAGWRQCRGGRRGGWYSGR